ncbi:MAG: helix-turn-helix transcriptional regulator [Oscillospiraceae bacterium]|nr:helix-turn-helix transcriptional regulator [Oscillospiraceae bacterium]
MDYYVIGQRIRARRKALGLSQEQLAERINISLTHMSHIETGNTKLSLPVLVALADALRTGTDALIYGQEAPGGTQAKLSALLRDCSEANAALLLKILQSVKESLER